MSSGVSTAPSGLSRPPQGQAVTSVENTRASRRAQDSRRCRGTLRSGSVFVSVSRSGRTSQAGRPSGESEAS
jgi:hypothetical protein